LSESEVRRLLDLEFEFLKQQDAVDYDTYGQVLLASWVGFRVVDWFSWELSH